MGLIVPKYGHTTVERNQLKRRLREIVRIRLLAGLPPSLDVVVWTKPGAYSAGFSTLANELMHVGGLVGSLVS